MECLLICTFCECVVYVGNAGLASGCNMMQIDMKYLQTENHHAPNCDMKGNVYRSLDHITDTPQSMCIVDHGVTDWNFMPFKIKGKGAECLTINSFGQSGSHIETETFLIYMSRQIDVIKVEDFNQDYIAQQLFYFYPLSSIPQVVRFKLQFNLFVPNLYINTHMLQF